MFNRIQNFFSKNDQQSNVIVRIGAFKNIEGWLTDNEAFGLYTIANQLPKNANVVEIGSWKGKSTYCIAQGLGKGTINCIDPFNASGEAGSKEIYEKQKGELGLLEQFKNNLSAVKDAVKINPLKGYSNEFVGTIKDINFLFIDGDHSIEGCKFDFVNFATAIKKGGYLAFHDYDPSRHDLGPTWVIDNLVSKDQNFKFYKSFDSLRVYTRI